MSWLRYVVGDCKRPGFFTTGLLVLLAAASCSANETIPEKTQVLHKVAQNWIQIGLSQYKRGLYAEAEKAFLSAREHQEYLTAEEHKQLEQHLEKAHQARVESKTVLVHLNQARKLLNQGQPIKARAHYEKVRNDPYLTKEQRRQIAGELKIVDENLDKRRKEITELYNHSVYLYRSGELEKAREGFVEVARYGLLVAPVGQSAEDYLIQIDSVLTRQLRDHSSGAPTEVEPASAPALPVNAPLDTKYDTVDVSGDSELELLPPTWEQQSVKKEQDTKKQSHNLAEEMAQMRAVAEPVPPEQLKIANAQNSKTRIICAYTKAIVEDAAVKVGYYIGRNEFDRAVAAVRTATEVVKENRTSIGDDLFTQYTIRLTQLANKIIQASKESQNSASKID